MAKKEPSTKKEKDKPSCFIIMPITTPEYCFQQYKGDKDHFKHVLKCLLIPAVDKAGFQPLLPESTGSEIIHADIIEKLTSSDMVLCDMSILNANVFFELGVRTSLNKPVALITDDKTSKIPFDIQPAQRNTYKSALNIWENDAEIEKVADHIKETHDKSQGQNSLWKRFKILDTAEFNTKDVTDDDRFQVLYQKIESLEFSLNQLEYPHHSSYKRSNNKSDSERQFRDVLIYSTNDEPKPVDLLKTYDLEVAGVISKISGFDLRELAIEENDLLISDSQGIIRLMDV